MLVLFPVMFAAIYITSVASILYVGLICKKDQQDVKEEGDSDSEYET